MSLVYWDSMLFIYWIEDHASYSQRIGELFARMNERGDRLCTSVFTLGEVLIGPYKRKQLDLVEEMTSFFRSPAVELLPFTGSTADQFARIRAQHRVAPADAIHLATASAAKTNLFLTNDDRLHRISIPGIDFVAGLDVNIL